MAEDDDSFAIYNVTDPTKTLRFGLSNITTDTNVRANMPSLPNRVVTWVLCETPNVFTDVQTIAAGTGGLEIRGADGLTLFDNTDAHGLNLNAATITGTRSVAFQDASGTLALLEAGQTWTLGQIFLNGIDIGDVGASSNTVNMVATTLTAARNHMLQNQGPAFNVLVGAGVAGSLGLDDTLGSLDATAQSAAIASTQLTNGAGAGYYLVHYTLADTTTQVGVATVQFQIGYTDDAGATTQAGATLSLTATGRDRGTFHVYLASGDITLQTNVVGVVGTGRYSLHVRVESLG